MVSIRTRGFLSDILMSKISFQRKTKQGKTSLFCKASRSARITAFLYRQWTAGQRLTVTQISVKMFASISNMAGWGKHLCFIFSIAHHAIWRCCVYSAFSCYILAGCSLWVSRTNILGLQKFPQYKCCPKCLAFKENKSVKEKKLSND